MLGCFVVCVVNDVCRFAMYMYNRIDVVTFLFLHVCLCCLVRVFAVFCLLLLLFVSCCVLFVVVFSACHYLLFIFIML